uniref:Tetratricopeptide repeat protein n=1 Tax=Desulfacinum infernum TaxID=35837 RepID=A0A832A2W4_9BACT
MNIMDRMRSCSYIACLPIVLMLILAAYSNTLYSPPVLDDFHSFVGNPATHVDAFTSERIILLSKNKFGIYRFIPMLTLAFDYWWGQGEFIAFHITNVIIHILVWAAVWFFVLAILRSGIIGQIGIFSPKEFSFIVASLWALHPVQTSAVTYIVQRMASLQTLFFLVSAGAYANARCHMRAERRAAAFMWAVVCGLSGIAACLSKENSAILPVIFILIEIWFFQPDLPRKLWLLWLRKVRTISGMLLSAFSLVGTAWLVYAVLKHFSQGYGSRHFNMTERLLTQSRVVMRYIYSILIPNPRSLSIEHDIEISRSLLSPPSTLVCIVLIIGLLVAAGVFRKKYPITTFGLLFFFGTLIIESTIVPLELYFDHRMYIPSVGLIFGVGYALVHGLSRVSTTMAVPDRRRLAWSVVAICCAFLSLLTFTRNQDWCDIVTINRDAAMKAPKHPRAHANYSVALARVGEYEKAIEEGRRALELTQEGFEEHVVAATSIVHSLMRQGKYQEAVEEGEKALAQRPSRYDATALPMLHLKMADGYRTLKNYEEAYRHAIQAVVLYNRLPDEVHQKPLAYHQLQKLLGEVINNTLDLDGDGTLDFGLSAPEEWMAQKLYELEDHDGARTFALQCARSRDCQMILSRVSIDAERTERQRREWDLVWKNLESPWRLNGLVVALGYAVSNISRESFFAPLRPMAERLMTLAASRNPWHADTHLLQGWYAFEAGRVEEAVSKARQAVELSPQSAKAWIALGFFEQRAGNLENSLAAFQQTLELYPGYPKRHVLKELMAQLETQLLAGSSGGTQHTAHAGLL